jgi:hypothetical protein
MPAKPESRGVECSHARKAGLTEAVASNGTIPAHTTAHAQLGAARRE